MSSAPLWIQAMQNVSAEVYALQLAEYHRLCAGVSPAIPTPIPTPTVNALVLRQIKHTIEAEAFRTRQLHALNGYIYQKIQLIQMVRALWNLGLKESKDLVDEVIAAIP